MKQKIGWIIALLLAMAMVGCADNSRDFVPSSSVIITGQPTDRSVVEGTAATFTVVATNATGYQWAISTDAGTTWSNVIDAINPSYITPVTTMADNGTQYRVVVSGASNTVTSSAVTLTVTAAPVAVNITVQPGDQTTTAGLDASFSVTATGTDITYQWQSNTTADPTFADIAGAVNATLTLTAVQEADSGNQYRVVVSNSLGSVTSTVATLTVGPAPALPAFTMHPLTVTVDAPNTATFTVVVTGNPAPTLQWQLSTDSGVSFSDIPGETGTSCTTAATTLADTGTHYRAVATNSEGSIASNVATLTVNPTPVPASIVTNPSDVTVTDGGNAQFTVIVDGTPTPTVQWEISTDAGITWGNIVGATSTTLDLIAVVLADSGNQYRAVATNSAGTATSTAATLTVTP